MLSQVCRFLSVATLGVSISSAAIVTLLGFLTLDAPLAAAQETARAGEGGQAALGPVFSDTGPDAEVYGAAAGFPIGDRTTASQPGYLVGTYSHFGEMFP